MHNILALLLITHPYYSTIFTNLLSLKVFPEQAFQAGPDHTDLLILTFFYYLTFLIVLFPPVRLNFLEKGSRF